MLAIQGTQVPWLVTNIPCTMRCGKRFLKIIKTEKTIRWRGASLVAQMVKNPPATQKIQVRSLGWDDPLQEEMATHSGILAWKIPWTEKPGRLQSMGLQTSVGHDWATNTHTRKMKKRKFIQYQCVQLETGFQSQKKTQPHYHWKGFVLFSFSSVRFIQPLDLDSVHKQCGIPALLLVLHFPLGLERKRGRDGLLASVPLLSPLDPVISEVPLSLPVTFWPCPGWFSLLPPFLPTPVMVVPHPGVPVSFSGPRPLPPLPLPLSELVIFHNWQVNGFAKRPIPPPKSQLPRFLLPTQTSSESPRNPPFESPLQLIVHKYFVLVNDQAVSIPVSFEQRTLVFVFDEGVALRKACDQVPH